MVKARRKPAAKKKTPAPVKKPSSSQNSSSQHSSSQSSSSSEQIQANIKTLQFRKRRGQKMNYLINKKKDQQDDDDDFWKNNAYFGDAENMDSEQEEEEEYVESSAGEDEFDSDFLSDQGDKDKQGNEQQEQEVFVEQEQSITKRKRKVIELNLHPPPKKPKPPTTTPNPTNPQTVYKPLVLKYIHEEFTQEQLLAEAAHTEYYNYLSLQKLISLEEGRKTYQRKKVELEEPKVVYKSRLEDGKAVSTYKMVGFEEGVGFLDVEDPV